MHYFVISLSNLLNCGIINERRGDTMNLNNTLSYVKEKGRKLDYYLILNQLSKQSYDEEIIDELLKYQNDDYGFGQGLEPDVQTPSSSVLASNIAIKILNDVASPRKEGIIKGLVNYFISQYIPETRSFNFVPNNVNDFPRAIWWNGDVNSNFGYFNPTPEVVGFLFMNRAYIENFEIESLVDFVSEKIICEISKINKPHSLYSVIKFYENLDSKRQNNLRNLIIDKTKELISTNRDEWKNYAPQPYKLITSKGHPLYFEYKDTINENMEFLLESISDNSVWMPEWNWGQFEELYFSNIQYKWMGFLTFERLKILDVFGYLDKQDDFEIE